MNDRSAMPSAVLGAKPACVERRATTSSLGLLALTIAPLAIWLVPFLNRERIGPFYLIGRVDPSYIYLLNSLLVSCGKNPRHIDHPGTPLQIVGALVIGAMNVIDGGNPICPVQDILTRPETYLGGISICLQFTAALLTALVGVRLYKLTGDIFAACITQICMLISPPIAGAFGVLGTEILVVPTILGLGLTLLPLATNSRPERPRDSIVAGMILGFGLATKITVFPLILYAFMFDSTKAKARFLAACFGSFIFWTLPIANMYRNFLTWMVNLGVHSGHYGEGAFGVPGIWTMAANARSLIFECGPIFLFACLAGAFAVWLRGRAARPSPPARFMMLSLAVLMLQLLMTAKHPAGRYMVPALVAVAVSSGVAVAALGAIRPVFSAICFALVLALGVGPAASNFRYFESELPRRHAQDRSDTEKIRRIAADRCGSLIPQTNGVSSQLSGLLFGNIFAEKFDLQLAKLYPDFVSYHVGDRFYGFTGRDGVNPPVDPGGKPICIFGTIELPATDAQKFRLVAREGDYRLYASE
jgi:hypothetical protein